MAHELEINEDGTANAFFVGKPAWHGLGILLQEPPTIKEALVYAGLDWKVEKRDLFLASGEMITTNSAIVRTSDYKVLGIVGNKYTPVQNYQSFNFFDKFLESGLVNLEAAGSLYGGSRTWILAKVKDDIVVKGNDTVKKYILLANSHDGSLAITAGYTPVRVVCNNTLSMATESGTSQLLKIRHTDSALITLDKVKEIMNVVNQSFEATAEQYQYLTTRIINSEQLEQYIKVVFKNLEKDNTRSENTFNNIVMLYESQGYAMPEIKDTAWAAYNAVTDYLSHEAGHKQDSRVNSLWFGVNAGVNKLALKEAVRMVA